MKYAGLIIMILILNLTLGAVCFDYSVSTIFGVSPSVVVDVVGGLVVAEVVIPTAIVLWLLQKSRIIHAPLIEPAKT